MERLSLHATKMQNWCCFLGWDSFRPFITHHGLKCGTFFLQYREFIVFKWNMLSILLLKNIQWQATQKLKIDPSPRWTESSRCHVYSICIYSESWFVSVTGADGYLVCIKLIVYVNNALHYNPCPLPVVWYMLSRNNISWNRQKNFAWKKVMEINKGHHFAICVWLFLSVHL